MRIFKPLAAVAAGFAFLALVNAAVTFAVVPFGSKSEVVWTDYSRQGELDTVMVGASLMQNAIDPALLDDLAGCKSYCLATPNQTIEESLFAIQTAYEDHGISRAILGVSSFDLQAADPPSLGDAFLYNRGHVASLRQNLGVAGQVLLRYGGATGRDSINALFPWVYNHVSLTPSGIAGNIRSRLSSTLFEAAVTVDPIWTYAGKGYGTYDVVLDYDEESLPFFSDDWEDGAAGVQVDPDRARTLADICAYCDERGIELVAVSIPMPVYNVVDGDGYYALHDAVSSAFSELGCDYYDFNFARPELFESQPDYFVDTIHLNGRGSRAFTRSFARFLGEIEAGADVEGEFYDADGQRASVDYISAVFADASVDEAGVHVTARTAAGPNVDAEYQLCVLDAETQTWQVVGDWTTDPAFDYAPAQRGVVGLRVNARQRGSQVECDRYRVLHVYY